MVIVRFPGFMDYSSIFSHSNGNSDSRAHAGPVPGAGPWCLPIDVDLLRRTRQRRLLERAAIVLALVSLPMTQPWAWLPVAVLLATMRLPLRPRFVRARLDADGRWWLFAADGRVWPARLLPGAWVHPRLIALTLRCAAGRQTVAVFPDLLSPDEFRRLRARVRLDG